jgi:hypothetical protein
MSTYPFGRCRRVALSGARCTMPAKHGGELCYNHERHSRLTRVRRPILPDTDIREPLVRFAYMEDHASILHNLNAIAQAFANNQIDHRQVGVLTYLMQTCLKTLRQMHELETRPALDEIVTDVVYDDQDLPLAVDPQTDPPSDPIPDPPTAIAADSPSPEPFACAPLSPEPLDLQAVAAAPERCPLTAIRRLEALSAPSSRLQAVSRQSLPLTSPTTHPFSNTCTTTQNNQPIFKHLYFKDGIGVRSLNPKP